MKEVQLQKQASLSELWLLSYPLIITMAAQMLMQFVDRMMLAWYSHDALAAVVPSGTLAFTFASLFMGLASYTSVFIAQYAAQKRRASVTISLWQGIFLGVLSAIILASLTPLGFWVINSFGHDEPVRLLELKYFGILNLFGGVMVVNNALGSFFSGRGETKITMFAAIVGNLVNILLDYPMIFGKLGFPEMGMAGAAWATVIGAMSMTCMYSILIFTKKNRLKFRVDKLVGFYRPVFTRLVKYGVPNGFGFLMDIMSFSLFAFMIGNIDKISLAASNVVLSLQPMVFTVILGLGMGIQILVGRYMGKKRPDLAVKVVKNACKIGYLYAGLIGVLFFFAAPLFVGIFIAPGSADAEQIVQRALPLMKLVSFFVLFDATYLIFGEALRGAGDTKFYMYVMLACAWGLLVPGTWFIVYRLHGSVFWVWTWLTFYAALTAVFMIWRFLTGRWKKINITGL